MIDSRSEKTTPDYCVWTESVESNFLVNGGFGFIVGVIEAPVTADDRLKSERVFDEFEDFHEEF